MFGVSKLHQPCPAFPKAATTDGSLVLKVTVVSASAEAEKITTHMHAAQPKPLLCMVMSALVNLLRSRRYNDGRPRRIMPSRPATSQRRGRPAVGRNCIAPRGTRATSYPSPDGCDRLAVLH